MAYLRVRSNPKLHEKAWDDPEKGHLGEEACMQGSIRLYRSAG